MRGLKEVILVTWTESERGWGCRPDGASLHLTREDAAAFIKEHNDSLPKEVPDEYTRADNMGVPCLVDAKLWERIKASPKGVRLWHRDFKTETFTILREEKPARAPRRKKG